MHVTAESDLSQTLIPAQRPFWVRAARHAIAVVLSILMALASFWLFKQHNDFPVRYHPDEAGKADQLIGRRLDLNFRHPLLLVETTNQAIEWAKTPRYEQDIVLMGRNASAGLAAMGVFAAAMAGYVGFGFWGLAFGGAMIGLCPPLLVFAHYFKEDAALSGGLLMSVLGAAFMVRAQRPWTQALAAIALGIGLAFSASGKLVGLLSIIPCLTALFIARNPNWWTPSLRTALFVIATIAGILAINHEAFVNLTQLQIRREAVDALDSEIGHGLGGHYILTLDQPNLYCLKVAISDVMPHIWVFLVAGAVWLIVWRKFSRWGIVLSVFVITYILGLTLNTIPIGRYALPITVLIYFSAAQMMAAILRQMRRPGLAGAAAAIVCMGIVLVAQGQRSLYYSSRFLEDGHQQLWEWIAKLPPSARISADGYAEVSTLADGDRQRHPNQSPLRTRIPYTFYVADYGTVDSQIRSGIQYVVVCDAVFDRFFTPGVHALPGSEFTFNRYRQFYDDLFKRGELVWSSNPPRPSHAYVDMDIRVYQIAKPPTAGSTTQPSSGGFLRGLFR